MTNLLFSNNLLVVYTNKASRVFSLACENMYNSVKGRYGIIYSDYDCDKKILDEWKQYNLQRMFFTAPVSKTFNMDDKILFHNKMKDSNYTPESYLKKEDIVDKNSLYFVKKRGSTASKGVNIYDYDMLKNIDTTQCVIQKNISNPDLYNGFRYKIRSLVLLYNKNVYLDTNSFISISNVQYNMNEINDNNLLNINVISQIGGAKFEKSEKLNNIEMINNNIKLAMIDFKTHYANEIENIIENEYCVLGFDIIVDSAYNVQIIEINHRSNYIHPNNVIDCDISFFKNMIMLLITGQCDKLICI